MFKHIKVLATIGTVLCVSTFGSVSADAAAADNTVVIGLAARDIGSMDPAFTRGNVDEFIVRQVFNTLVSPPDGTLAVGINELQGELAERWEVSEDAKLWTFYLREGVKWQKGYGNVTAEDVKFSFERQIDPATGAIYAASFEIIDKIEVVDPLTIRFHLKEPNAFFHVTSLLPRFGPYIVPKKAVEELGKDFGLRPVGSGPFEFVSYEPMGGIELKANADYYGGAPKVDRVSIKLMPETSARTLAFLGSELDIMEGARSPGWISDMKRKAPNAIFDSLQPGSTQSVFFNLSRPPFNDLRIRQAVAHAVDRKVWEQAFGEISGAMYGPAPVEFYGSLTLDDLPEELRYEYNPDKAKALLAEAGVTGTLNVDVFISEREDYRSNMLLLQDQLRKVGINLNLRVVDHASYHADIAKDLNPLIVYSTSQSPIVVPILQAFFTSDAIITKPSANRNFSHYGDVVGNIDAALAAAIAEPDPAAQLKQFKEIQLQIMRDLPVLPLQSLAFTYVRQPNLDLGFTPKAGLGHFTLGKARFK